MVGQIYHLPYALNFFYCWEKAGKEDYSRLSFAFEENRRTPELENFAGWLFADEIPSGALSISG